jgi:cell wall-associated NlpC family hydrolase
MSCRHSFAAILALLLLAGCAAQPRTGAPAGGAAAVAATPGGQAAVRALELVGMPYRYGGNGPDAFDCSGLVRYVYAEQGVRLPRTAEAQFAAGQPVEPGTLVAGDLVFFRIPQAHIGIFTGRGQFVHAPATGRAVSVARLDEPWFMRAYVGAVRVVQTPAAAAPQTSPAPPAADSPAVAPAAPR